MTFNELKKAFTDIYGEGGTIRFFASPGRVNLIGEHIDYNGGFVFPAALTQGTVIALRERSDGIIRLKATDLDDLVTLDINNLSAYKDLKWGNYQAGVAYVMQQDGYTISGCDMLFDDTLPHGGGLSSSAGIEVAAALAFATLSNEKNGIPAPVDMIEMARYSQKAENEYVGVSCGIMDQFASAMGKKDCAILLKCDTLEFRHIPLDMKGYSIVISNTNKKRNLADSKYNERCDECAKGLKMLQAALPDINFLCELTPEVFEQNKHLITDETVLKRVRHVVNENARVLKSVDVLKQGDLASFGALMNASHDSLRDDYAVTGIELDTLVDEARKIDGTLGSRMTGAGFGGCTVSLVKDDAVENFIEKVGAAYTKKIGYAPSFYRFGIGDGGRELKEEA